MSCLSRGPREWERPSRPSRVCYPLPPKIFVHRLTNPIVAEVLKVPLYVVDLGQVADELEDAHLGRPAPLDRNGRRRLTIEDAFAMAARWKALLLIDECDLYLEPRSESTPARNRVVTSTSPFTPLHFLFPSFSFCNPHLAVIP